MTSTTRPIQFNRYGHEVSTHCGQNNPYGCGAPLDAPDGHCTNVAFHAARFFKTRDEGVAPMTAESIPTNVVHLAAASMSDAEELQARIDAALELCKDLRGTGMRINLVERVLMGQCLHGEEPSSCSQCRTESLAEAEALSEDTEIPKG